MTPLRIPPPALKLPSPAYSDSSAEEEGDASFAASTQNYLLSPTGKEALGRVGMIILSPMTQSAVDLDIHADSQQLIRKPIVSKVGTMKDDKHYRPPSLGLPETPKTFASFVPLPDPTGPAPQDFLSPELRPQRPAESPVERTVRSSKSRENLSISAWPRPPTAIPLSSSPPPTLSPSRGFATPSPTPRPSPSPTAGSNSRDSYYDFVRQPSPTFAKMTITNRDRAYIFGAPSLPHVPSPPPQVPLPQVPTLRIAPADPIPELKEVETVKSPVFVPARWGSSNSQVTWSSVVNGNVDADAVSPSVSSFVESPSIYSTYSGNQPHPAGTMYINVVKETA